MFRPRNFGIRKYFAIGSAVTLLPAMILVWALFQQHTVRDLTELSERHNVSLALTIAKPVWVEFGAYFDSVKGATGDQLRARPEIEQIDQLLRKLTAGLAILKVKIYDPDGLTVYSSEHAQMGELREEEDAFYAAMHEGQPRSALSNRDRFSAFSGEVFNRDVIETYVPVRNDAGDIVGVFELYSDVTALKTLIDQTVVWVIGGVIIVFVLIYGSLVFIVMRWAMEPVEAASHRAAEIGPASTGVRLPTERMPIEILPLIEAVNGALERLDHALDAQREFTADAAHELLTPLAVITTALDSISDKQLAAEIKADIQGLSDLVQHLLELSELDAIEGASQETANVGIVCQDVIARVAPLAYRDGKSVSFIDNSAGTTVRCCPRLLDRAVRNLIENAVLHTPAGTSVEVKAGVDGSIEVTDNGPGIAPERREQIFHRFWRGEAKNRPGAGLGLSIVKQFVDAHGGTIDVADAPGGGAQFTLRLPTVAAEPANALSDHAGNK